MMKKLIEKQSIHEQREDLDNFETKIEKGTWIEIIDFEIGTEKVKVYHRWEIIDIKKEIIDGKENYTIICNKINIEENEKIREELAKKIIEKHNNILKSSFAKCLIEGIEFRPTNNLIEALYKLGGDIK